MKCQQALEILEAARPDSSDRDEPELTAASAHLDACPRCAELFDNIQTLDRRVGQVMRDVAVPAGLQKQLLEATATAEIASRSAVPTRQNEPAETARPNRRKWLGRTTAAAVCLTAGIGLWLFLRPPVTMFSVDELRQIAADADFQTLPPFSGHFQAILPPGGHWQNLSIQLASQARGIPATATDHQAAVYSFRVPVSRTESVPGALLILPADAVDSPPAATTFNSAIANQKYVWSTSGTEYETITWTSGGLVYVVSVGAGNGALESLQRAIEFTPA